MFVYTFVGMHMSQHVSLGQRTSCSFHLVSPSNQTQVLRFGKRMHLPLEPSQTPKHFVESMLTVESRDANVEVFLHEFKN